MRILYAKSAELIPYAYQAFLRMGAEVELTDGIANITESSEELTEALNQILSSKGVGYYDAVFSFNYFFAISDACERHG